MGFSKKCVQGPVIQNLKIQLSILEFLQFFVWGAWFVTTGTYLLQTLEFSGTQVGLVYGAPALASMIAPFLVGVLADRFFSIEKILSLLHFLGGIVLFIVSSLKDFYLFYPVLIVYTLLYTPTFALSSSLCFHHLENPKRDFPLVRVWGTIGWIAVGLLVGHLQLEPTVIPLKIAAVSSLLLSIFSLGLPHTPPTSKGSRFSFKQLLGLETLALLRNRSFAVLMIGLSLITLPSSFYYSFVNPYLNELGIANTAGKMSIGQASEIIFILILPFCLRRLPLKYIILTGMLAWSVRYFLFAYANSTAFMPIIYVGLLLHGISYSFTFLAGQIFIDGEVPVEMRSSAQGFITLITMGFGPFLGALLAGWIVSGHVLANEQHQWETIWLYPASIGAITFLFFLLFFQSKKAV